MIFFSSGLISRLIDFQLLLPNPYMSEIVAQTHLVETASSNFIFGWLVGWLLSQHHSSLHDLLGLAKVAKSEAA